MKTEESFNAKESLQLIDKMIRSAQENVEDSSFYYLIWGWAVLIAAALNYSLIQMHNAYNYIGWLILMPLTAVITVIYSIRGNKSQPVVKTYTQEVINYVLIAFVITLFVVLVHGPLLLVYTYPMVMLTYGSWLFISGGALKFKPLIFGGIVNWILGIIAFYVSFENQLLLISLAVLLGYIIPGHMLRSRFRARDKSIRTV